MCNNRIILLLGWYRNKENNPGVLIFAVNYYFILTDTFYYTCKHF